MNARAYLDEAQARADKATPETLEQAQRDLWAARTDVPKLADMLRIALDALELIREGAPGYTERVNAHQAISEIDRRAEQP